MAVSSVDINDKGIGHIDKDPDAILDYPFRFGNWLAVGETILTKSFVDVQGVTVDSSSIEDDTTLLPAVTVTLSSMVLAWISGGTIGEAAQVTCRITTSGGRTYDRTLKFKVRAF